MIAGGESLFARDFDQALQFRESCAFVIIGMAKPEVNRVVLIIKIRMRGARFVDELNDARQLFLILRDQALRSVCFVDDARAGLLVHEIEHFRENGRGGGVELGVIAGHALIPIAKRFPFLAVLRGTENIALAGQNKIGVHREIKIDQA